MLRRFLLFSIFLLFIFFQVDAQNIDRPRFTPNELNNPGQTFCQAEVMNVEFQAENFNQSNIFRVQLSNLAGNFANPVVIGQLTATSGNLARVACNIPQGTVLGSGYRIRVVASNQAFTSPVNEHPFTIAPGLPAGASPDDFGTNSWIAHVHGWSTTESNITIPIADTIDFFNPANYTARFEVDSLSFNFNFGNFAPGNGTPGLRDFQGCVKPDFFAIRFKRRLFLDSGFYSFRARGDDGFRFSTDGGASWLITSWQEQAPSSLCHNNCCGVFLGAGLKDLIFEFFEEQIGATCSLTIEKAGPPGPITPPPAITVCPNLDPFQLNFTPSGGIFSGIGVDRTGIFYPNLAGSGAAVITYRTGLGPCLQTSDVIVTVTSGPIATISGLDSSYCIFDGPVNVSVSPAGGTLSGPGIVGNTSFNPSAAGIGLHSLLYIVSEAGCSDTTFFDVNVLPGGSITFEIPDSLVCQNGDSVSLTALPEGGTFSGEGVQGNFFNPARLAAGVYAIRYRIAGSSNCGDTSAMAQVRVKRIPNPAVTNVPASVCENGADIALLPLESGGVFSGLGIIGNLFSPQNVTETNQVVIRYFIETEGCADSSQQTIAIERPVAPVVSISNFLPRYCNSEPTFTLTVQPPGGILLLNGLASSSTINPQTLNPGLYQLVYTFKPATTCLDTFTANGQLEVIAKPQLSGLSDQTISQGESVQLTVSGASSYLWTPIEGLNATNIPNPLASPEESIVYTVEGKDETGFCADTATVSIRVFEPLFIPNVITFNGDGKNDTWDIKGLRTRTLNKIEIFDRWGNKVLNQTSYPNPWDGKVNEQVRPGTYFFHIDFEVDTDRKGILTILGEN